MIRTLIVALCALSLLCSTASAQPPPPFGPIAQGFIGGAQWVQPGGANLLAQVSNAYTDPTMLAPAFFADPPNERRVRLGQSIGWLSTCNDPLRGPGSYLPFMAISTPGVIPLPLPWIPVALPGAAPLFDEIYVDPALALILTPHWVVVPPPLPWPPNDLFMFVLPIPNTTSLVGTLFSTQWLRIDPIDGLIYLSDEHHVRVAY